MMKTVIVSATDFIKNFAHHRETVQKRPVMVTGHKRTIGYFISRQAYEEYQQLRERLPKAYAVEELSEETIRAIADSRMDKRHDSLNSLLDDE